MKRKKPAAAPIVNECPQCTTPGKCGRQDLSGARGPRCVGRADGLDACDCLNRCGDDPWLAKGLAQPCERRRDEQAAAEFRATAGPTEYASWFPIGVHVPRVTRMPVERIASLWNSLPLETDAASVVAFVRAVERFHGLASGGANVQGELPAELPPGAMVEGYCIDPADGLRYPYGSSADGTYWIADQFAWAGWTSREARDRVLANQRRGVVAHGVPECCDRPLGGEHGRWCPTHGEGSAGVGTPARSSLCEHECAEGRLEGKPCGAGSCALLDVPPMSDGVGASGQQTVSRKHQGVNE